jgi:hypothetical protein
MWEKRSAKASRPRSTSRSSHLPAYFSFSSSGSAPTTLDLEGGQPLLAVDHLGLRHVRVFDQHYRTQEVRLVRIAVDRVVQVVQQVDRLLSAPGVRPLVVGDGELVVTGEHLGQRDFVRLEFLHPINPLRNMQATFVSAECRVTLPIG